MLENYRALRDGAFGDARRLSSRDRERLDEYVMDELERKLTVHNTCDDLDAPTKTPIGTTMVTGTTPTTWPPSKNGISFIMTLLSLDLNATRRASRR